jgi:HlyD family secretion protein
MIFSAHSFEPKTSPLDFQPAILAMQQRPPSPLPRALLYTLLALFGSLLVWSFFGRIDIVATAPGKLVPQTYVKIVQPAEAGIIAELLVREGDRVTAGQVLLRLDTTVSNADAAIVRREVEARALQLRRIDSEMTGAPMTRGTGDTAAFDEVRAQAAARRRAYDDSIATERAALAQVGEELEGAQAQVVKLEQLLPIYREEETSLDKLAAQGLVPRFQLSEKRRERIEAEQNLSSQRRTVSALRSRGAAASARLARVDSEYRQTLLGERIEAQSVLDKAREEYAKQEHRGRLSELRAPQDGIIKDVATYTVGAVVDAGTVLMSLVPVQDELVAEVMIRNDDVGFVHEGQRAKIKLSTYPFQKYGMIEGTVVRISADASELERGTAPGAPGRESLSPYKAVVKLEAQRLHGAGTDWPIAPGMQVVAEVKQGDRTVMEYLLSPVSRIVGEAGRER